MVSVVTVRPILRLNGDSYPHTQTHRTVPTLLPLSLRVHCRAHARKNAYRMPHTQPRYSQIVFAADPLFFITHTHTHSTHTHLSFASSGRPLLSFHFHLLTICSSPLRSGCNSLSPTSECRQPDPPTASGCECAFVLLLELAGFASLLPSVFSFCMTHSCAVCHFTTVMHSFKVLSSSFVLDHVIDGEAHEFRFIKT